MKKIISIVLVLMMTVMLCACGNGEKTGGNQGGNDTLQVGFGREQIMPEGTVRIAGGGVQDRLSTGFMDYLYVTCVAVTDASGETVLIYSQDLHNTNDGYIAPVKEEISKETGISVDHIMMSATHTHSAPAIATASSEGIAEYRVLHKDAAVKAAKDALADRSAAEAYIGSTQTEGLASVRHYLLSNGTYAGSNFGDFSSGSIVEHAAKADGEAQIIKFTRADESKKDVLLMSFTVHPCFNGSSDNTVLSADLVGTTRDYLEANTDCLVAYFTSDAGNQTQSSRVASENRTTDYTEYGAILGKYVIDTLPSLTKVNGNEVKLKSQTYTAQTNKDKVSEMLDKAIETVDAYNNSGKSAADPLVAKYGFSSVHEARGVVTRSKLGDTLSFELNVLSIGDNLSFIFAPYEMFAATGMYIKENTPYDMTFIVSHANGEAGYFPTEAAFDHGCYEVYISKCVRGTAESVADTYLEMLTQLKNG